MEYLVSVYRKAKRVIAEPEAFFRSAKKEKGFDAALKYLATVAIVFVFFTTLRLAAGRGVTRFLYAMLSEYLGLIVGFLLVALFIQVFALILGGKNSYDGTFRVLVYAFTPFLLVGWIHGLVAFVASLYTIYLLTKGTSIFHEVSMWRAFAIVFLPLVAMAAMMILMALVIFSAVAVYGLLGNALPTAGLL